MLQGILLRQDKLVNEVVSDASLILLSTIIVITFLTAMICVWLVNIWNTD